MKQFQDFVAICIFRMYLLGYILYQNSIEATDATDHPGLSCLALKMRSVCPRQQIFNEYMSTCSKSSISIQPNVDTTPSSLPPELAVNAIVKVRKQNELIMTELINRAVYNNQVPAHQPKFGFQLVSTVLALYSRICPVVPPSFLQTVYHLFSFIHWKTAHNRNEYLPKRHQKWISKLIFKCMANEQPPKFFTDICQETLMTVGNCSKYICTDPKNEFHLMKTDPIVDIIFKSLEVVQSFCFTNFKESNRMFHFFQLAFMDTFTEDIKTRWTTQLEDFTFWQRLLGPNFDTHLINLERCSEAVISNTKFHYRIPRTSLPARIRIAGETRKIVERDENKSVQ